MHILILWNEARAWDARELATSLRALDEALPIEIVFSNDAAKMRLTSAPPIKVLVCRERLGFTGAVLGEAMLGSDVVRWAFERAMKEPSFHPPFSIVADDDQLDLGGLPFERVRHASSFSEIISTVRNLLRNKRFAT